MMLLGVLLNALVQFVLYSVVGLDSNACIIGFLIGSIMSTYLHLQTEG